MLATPLALAVVGCARSVTVAPRLYADGLSFLPEDMKDISTSRIGAMICDVSQVEEVKDPDGTPRYLRTFARNDTAIDAAIALVSARSDVFIAKRGTEIGTRAGCAAFFQFQSCETIGSDLSRIERFHTKGLRVLQFTHHNNNLFAGGCLEVKPSGLTAIGIDGLVEMNRLRVLPDVSHGSEATMLEAAERSTTPIIYSHGACRAIVDHPRCISDKAIRAIASRGGTVGTFMMSFWLTTKAVPTPDHFIAHLRHVAKVGGIDAVTIANDFPMAGQTNLVNLGNNNAEGVKEYLPWWQAMRALGLPGFAKDPEHVVIPEFNRIERMMLIERLLEKDGFTALEVDKIMGRNLARVLTDVLG